MNVFSEEQINSTTVAKADKEKFWFVYGNFSYDLPKNYSGYFAVSESILLLLSKGKIIKEHLYPL